jgi:hypothetical protein
MIQNETQATNGDTKHLPHARLDERAVIDEFTEPKRVTIDPYEQQYPFRLFLGEYLFSSNINPPSLLAFTPHPMRFNPHKNAMIH